MSKLINRLLLLPGVHFLATRLGPAGLRQRCFDAKFAGGDWCFSSKPDLQLGQAVEKYSRGGAVLALGCGTGSVAAVLPPSSYSSFTGVDLSPTAISIARSQQANSRVRFEIANMETYICSQQFNVILFSESLNYVASPRRKTLLKRLQHNLGSGGNFIVTISDPVRYRGIIRTIRDSFEVVEDRSFTSSRRHLLVFHGVQREPHR